MQLLLTLFVFDKALTAQEIVPDSSAAFEYRSPCGSPLTLISTSFLEGSQVPNYEIALTLPTIAGEAHYVATTNEAIRSVANEIVGTWRTYYLDDGETPCPAGAGNCQYRLRILYSLIPNRIYMLSLRFYITSYTGGAGENLEVRSLNIGPNGRILQLKDLFVDSQYLSTIAALLLDGLQQEQEYLRDAIPPVLQSYDTENPPAWNLSAEGLAIAFNEGEVAANAAGIVELTIPYEKLRRVSPVLADPWPLCDRDIDDQ